MRTDILDYLQQEVYTRCRRPANQFGMGCYDHIEAVVRNGALLAERYGADKEIVMIAAWLHDIASVTDPSLYENHHIHGAEIAYDLLSRLSYDPSKLPVVQDCIRSHRGSVPGEKQCMEAICVSDADAISHFDNVPGLLYLAYARNHMELEAGAQCVKEKLNRSYRKLSPESRAFYQNKYLQVMGLFG